MFERDSRYYYIQDKILVNEDGTQITYKSRRIIPQADSVPSAVSLLSEGKRIDQVSYAALGNAKLSWKFADANLVFSPDELSKKDQKIRVPSDGNNR